MSIKKLVLFFGLLGGVSSEILAGDFHWDCISDIDDVRDLEDCRASDTSRVNHCSSPDSVSEFIHLFHDVISAEKVKLQNLSKQLAENIQELLNFIQIAQSLKPITKKQEKLAENLLFLSKLRLTHREKFSLEFFKLKTKNILNQMIISCGTIIISLKNEVVNEVDDAQVKNEIIKSFESYIQFCEDTLELFL